MTSEILDSYFASLATRLQRKEINFDQLLMSLKQEKVLATADGENIKMLLRTAFMSSHMFSPLDGLCIALVAYELSKLLKRAEVNYTMDIGVGHAVSCAAYAMSVLGRMAVAKEFTTSYQEEALSLLLNEGEYFDAMEVSYDLGQIFEEAEEYSTSASCFLQAIELMQQGKKAGSIAEQRTSQTMVRLDSHNIFNFLPFRPLDVESDKELNVILHERLAGVLLQAQRSNEAMQYAKVALDEFHRSPDYVEVHIALRILATHASASAAAGDLQAAKRTAAEYVKLADKVGHLPSGIQARLILAFCSQQEGDMPGAEELKHEVSKLLQQMEK